MLPKVSIVVATYHRSDMLKRALESLGKQTCRDFEIILVDDNDQSEWNNTVAEIAEGFKADSDISLELIVNHPNQGSAKTRNIGINAARGEYISFLDDDDVYLPEKIEKQLGFMEKRGLDYSITDLYLYNEKDVLIDKRIRSYIKNVDRDSLLKYHLKHHITGTDTMMFRKDYLKKIGGFDPIDVGDEFYLMQKAIMEDGKFGYLFGCEVKAYVHTGEGGLSSGDGKIKGENALYEYKKSFFDKIDSKTRRYIRMRHYAVIAFAEIRRKKVVPFVCNAAKSFFCAPIACVRMFFFER